MSRVTFSAATLQKVKNYRAKFIKYGRTGLAKVYDDWAENGFDEDSRFFNRKGHQFVTQVLAKAFPNNKDKVRVLDIGTGTGQFAEQLRDEGFKLIDALDPSQKMLDKAKEKNVFQNFYCYFLSDIDGVIQDDAYDITCGYAIIGPGHFGERDIYQMLRITRPGGLMCVSGSSGTWREYLEPVLNVIKALTKCNKVDIIEECTLEYLSLDEFNEKGVLIIMRKV